MGVSGSGKSTIGSLLAEKLKINFYDGDDFHSEENIKKMASGTPLTDEDRNGWLQSLNTKAKQLIDANFSAVIACSALKQNYRTILKNSIEDQVVFIYLSGDFVEISERMKLRKGHFMPLDLLKNQFEILEIPKNAIEVNINQNPNQIIDNIMNELNKNEFGLVGLGVMGKSLARNLASNGVKLSLFNRYVEKLEEDIAKNCIAQYPEFEYSSGFQDLKPFVDSLKKPRKIFLMIKAGNETDLFIDEIKGFLSEGDIIIDGGNSHFLDTKRRIESLKKEEIHFIGTGVSGGEKGALKGPSIMPSGNREAYSEIETFLKKIAAKDKNGNECCTYIGKDGSGHFIKMVHNGIEYAEMQLLAEIYAFCRYILKWSPSEIANHLEKWLEGELKSYLLEITVKILKTKEGEEYLIDKIVDQAGNKGTGNWTTVTATEMGVPVTMITASLFARYLSETRNQYCSLIFESVSPKPNIDIENIRNAYQLARFVNHQQGFNFIQNASEKYNWDLNLSEIARIWTNGCIIRSELMETLVDTFKNNRDMLEALDKQKNNLKTDLRLFCLSAIQFDLAIPCMITANDYLNSLNKNHKTANIIQAQRDFFGAHTYKRYDADPSESFHTVWE
jgi:6-phosphogluconate dehydrogenase